MWSKYESCFHYLIGFDFRAVQYAVASYRAHTLGAPEFDWWFPPRAGE